MQPSPPQAAKAATAESAAKVVVALGVAGVLGLAFVYLFLAWPALDDYCRSAPDPRVGGRLWQVLVMYMRWTGRWAVTGVHAFVTRGMDLEGFGFTLVLMLCAAAWVAAFALAAGLVLGRGARRRDSLALGLLLFAVFWAAAPAGEVLYWYSGAVDYGLAFLLMMAALRLVLVPGGTGRAVAAAALGFLATGVHELAGGVIAAAALARALYALRTGDRRLAGRSALVLAAVAAGLLINLAAPGNAARAAQMAFGGQLRTALALTLKPSQTPLRALLDIRLLALGLFLFALPGFRKRRPDWTQARLPWLLLLPASTLAILLGGHFITAFAVGFEPPERVRAFLFALVLVGWTATLAAAAARFAKGNRATGPLAAASAAALCLALAAAPNSRAAVRGLPRALGEWRSQNAAREASIAEQRSAGRRDLLLPPVAAPPPPLLDAQIGDDPGWWVNACAARFYGAATVRAQGVAGPAPRRLWRGER
jgi:hypothetical protein